MTVGIELGTFRILDFCDLVVKGVDEIIHTVFIISNALRVFMYMPHS
jgi:hypothetical protein